jgi:hypothetical protein
MHTCFAHSVAQDVHQAASRNRHYWQSTGHALQQVDSDLENCCRLMAVSKLCLYNTTASWHLSSRKAVISISTRVQ